MLKRTRILITLAGLLACTAASAELVKQSNNFIDTDTGLEWRISLPTNNAQTGYADVFGLYEAGTTYRYPTAAEVDDLLGKLFPNFVATDASGRCAEVLNNSGGYPEQLEEAEAFLKLFGDSTPDAGAFEGLYEDASGTLRALWVHLIPWHSEGDVATTCLTGRYADYEDHRSGPIPSSSTFTLMVRPEVDRKASSVTIFDYLSPSEIGLYVSETLLPHENYCVLDGLAGAYGDGGWTSVSVPGFFCWYDNGQLWTLVFDYLGATPSIFNEDKLAPWVRIASIDYAGTCDGGDSDIGDGWCRRNYADTWYFTGEPVVFPGTYFAKDAVDNIVVEQVWENADIDFQPFDATNEARPKEAYFITVKVNTTSTADGDAFDLNAADIDPLSLRLGRNNAEITSLAAVLSSDYDNDGDIDYIFGFRLENTGLTCLDDEIRLAGTTYSGDPIAGFDDVLTTGCEETVDIDVDPFNVVNTIRPDDDYNIVVALLGMRQGAGDSVDFFPERERTENSLYSADGLDRDTLRFGPAATPITGSPIVTDVDGDSYDDLLVNFNVFDAGIACEDTEVEVTGEKNSGIPIEGFNAIVTEDCTTASCHP